ncbi:MAG: trypsin-like serine protease [Nannocystaceae bacterium]
MTSRRPGPCTSAIAIRLAPLSCCALAIGLLAPTASLAGGLRAAPEVDPIIGGRTTEPGEFDGVVAIQAGNGLCTGTVVAARLVLTAAHCLDQLDDSAEVVVHYGQEINKMTVGVRDWGVHPRFCPECKEDIFDYGYVEIEADFSIPGGFILPITTQVGPGDDAGQGSHARGLRRLERRRLGPGRHRRQARGHHHRAPHQPGRARVLRRQQRHGLVQRRLQPGRVRARRLGRAAAGRHHVARVEPVRQR